MATFLVNTGSELVDDLVTSVIKSARLPISQIVFQQQDIVGFFAEEQQNTIQALVKKIREDYWLVNYDQQVLASVYTYAMPPRCSAGALRDWCFVDPGGFEIELPHLDPSQLKVQSFLSFRPLWQGQGAFLQDDKVVLWPQTVANVAYKLRQKYERRPNLPTLAANCMQITGVNVGLNQVSFAGSPPFSIGGFVDIISNVGQFTSQGDQMLISNLVGSVMTFDPSTPLSSSVAIGMWVCPAGLTCVPQVPFEGYPLYVARALFRIATALGNQALFQVATKMAEETEAKLVGLLTPRVTGTPKKFVNRNHVGGLMRVLGYR